MASPEWFRNTTWSTAIEQGFFARLNRSRSQRDQYLALQALALAEHYPEVALRLSGIYFDTRKTKFNDARALSAKATAFLRLGDDDSALETYHAILAHERTNGGLKTNAFLDYPYLVATRQLKDEYEFALRVLEEHKDQVAFPAGRFMWSAAYALILYSSGYESQARLLASNALSTADETQSEFRYHRALGLVGKRHEETIAELRRIGA